MEVHRLYCKECSLRQICGHLRRSKNQSKVAPEEKKENELRIEEENRFKKGKKGNSEVQRKLIKEKKEKKHKTKEEVRKRQPDFEIQIWVH